jgi:hypothetical protein
VSEQVETGIDTTLPLRRAREAAASVSVAALVPGDVRRREIEAKEGLEAARKQLRHALDLIELLLGQAAA